MSSLKTNKTKILNIALYKVEWYIDGLYIDNCTIGTTIY